MIYIAIFLLLIGIALIVFLSTGPKISVTDNQLIKEVQETPVEEHITGITGTANNNGVTIFYNAFGKPEKGNILLVNGHTQTLLDWPTYFFQPLVDAGYRVIRYDNRGVGMSDWMEGWNKTNAYTLEDMATDALAILDDLSIKKAHIIGVSMGGMISQRLAISHADRVLSLCSIMSTGYYFDKELTNVPRQFMLDITRISMRYGRDVKPEANKLKLHLAIRQLLKGKGKYPFDTKSILKKALYEVRKRRAYNMKATDQHSLAIKKSGSRYEGLKQIQMPVLVVHGTTDPLIGIAHAKKYAAMIPNAETLFIEGMGHDLPETYMPQIIEGILSNCMHNSDTYV